MKIALFVHCFFPDHFYGTETYTYSIAKNLQAMGHDPVVVSAVFPGEPKKDTVVSKYEYDGIPVVCIDKNYLPNTRVKDTYYQPEMRSLLRDMLTEIKPDIIHITHLINHTAVLLEVAESLGIKAVATLTDFFGFCFNNKLEAADGTLCSGPNQQRTNCLACYLKANSKHPGASLLERLAEKASWARPLALFLNVLIKLPGARKGALAGTVLDITMRPDILETLYKNYKAVIAPTRFLKRAYLQNGLSAPVYDIRFGVDLKRKPKDLRTKGASLKIGYIGQIAAHKGTDILIDAFRQLPRGYAELHIFGPADQDPGYMEQLTLRARGYDVYFRGTFPKEEIGNVFSELDYFVIPSTWYENSPLVLLDALASHTPVIVSDVEGLTEFVEEGQNGYVFKRGSVSDLLRVLTGIVADPVKARELSDSTEYARTTRMMTEEALAVYAKVLVD
ncbi:MAG: glycosyltransferase family 4 protein [Desulfuromonadales bacterium]|nr:glycosyltransferase family 4 protein [Desulfuromonadales bacterium]